MRGDTHVRGGFLVNDKLRLPMAILYLAVKPSLLNAVAVYFLYNAITMSPASIGALLPDYDHRSRDSCPSALPSPWSELYYNRLMKWGASHRSIHTHNLDLWSLLLGVPAFLLLGVFINTKHDIWFLCFLHINAYLMGVLSHQFLDMLTIAGVTPSFLTVIGKKRKFHTEKEFRQYQINKAVRVTPRNRTMYYMKPIRIGRFKTIFAKPIPVKLPQTEWGRTGGGWEDQISKMMMLDRIENSRFRRRIRDVLIIVLIYHTLA